MAARLRSSGLFLMVLAGFFFSLMTVFVKLLGKDLPTAEVVLVRSIIAAFITWMMLLQKGEKPFGNKRFLLFLRGATGTVGLLCFYYAIPRLELAEVTVIQYTNPIFVVIIAAFLLKETFGRVEVVSIVLGFLGVLFIARIPAGFSISTMESDVVALAVALTGALFAGVAYVLVRKLTATEHPLAIVLSFPLVSILVTIPMLVGNFVWPSAIDWVYLVLVGITAQVAQVLMTLSYKAETAARASSASYIQLFWAILWGIIIFREIPDVWLITGSALIISGILVLSVFRKKPVPAT